MRRDVFQAIADPTRRAIIHMISQHALNLNAVAEHFDVSRPAISKHIKILTECGLVVINRQGRERICEAKLEKLNEVAHWVEQYKKFWMDRMDRLETFLDLAGTKRKAAPAKKVKMNGGRKKNRRKMLPQKNTRLDKKTNHKPKTKKHGNT